MALHLLDPPAARAQVLLPPLDTRRLCAPFAVFSFLCSLICYQSIYKYHVINRETRNSKGDFQYFLPLSTGLCSCLPAASSNERIVQAVCSSSFRRIHLGYGTGDRSIGKISWLGKAKTAQKTCNKKSFSGS